uniref:Uncharacterized protein n=1 Tax=Romanomermis culicivorax TaxID=13658 RepID=A0A915JPN2_ROMCU
MRTVKVLHKSRVLSSKAAYGSSSFSACKHHALDFQNQYGHNYALLELNAVKKLKKVQNKSKHKTKAIFASLTSIIVQAKDEKRQFI